MFRSSDLSFKAADFVVCHAYFADQSLVLVLPSPVVLIRGIQLCVTVPDR